MSYGHAERTLATIRLIEAETRDLLTHQEHLTAEQERWLREAADSASWRLNYFVDPQELELRLRRLGWDCAIRRADSRWVYGQARPAR